MNLRRKHISKRRPNYQSNVKLEILEHRRMLATFTVDTVSDMVSPRDGVTSLREAIQFANEAPNDPGEIDRIEFEIADDPNGASGLQTIRPRTELPSITDPVVIDGFTQPGSSPNTNAVGSELNAAMMIEIDGGLNTSTGLRIATGDSIVRGLVISNFVNVGIAIEFGAGNNRIEGNYIGTDASGLESAGNRFAGVTISSPNNVVGGTTAEARNLVSGNGSFVGEIPEPFGAGIFISSGGSDNRVEGNLIGTDATGQRSIGNIGNGVRIVEGSNNTIGGTSSESANVIAFNASTGVAIVQFEGATTGNSIRGNSIHSNGGLGIDLRDDGPTNNDDQDPDRGPNLQQNSPVLSHFVLGSSTSVCGDLNSIPNAAFDIDFYANSSDTTGIGERFLGSGLVQTDASGNVSFSIGDLSAIEPDEQFVTATATDASGNTSEFSNLAFELVRSITGTVFEDVSLNGLTEDDLLLNGVTVELIFDSNGNGELDVDDPVVDSTQTLSDGSYTLSEVAGGLHFIRQVVPDGFRQILGGDGDDDFYRTEVNSCDPFDTFDFGNTVPGSIHAFKFDDVDADGVFTDGTDRPLSDVEFELTGTNGLGEEVNLSVRTNDDGRANFVGLIPSVSESGENATGYTVREIVPAGSVATTAVEFTTNLSSRQEFVAFAGDAALSENDPQIEIVVGSELQFGNTEPGSISAFKFEDRDANGSFDDTVDEPLEGVEFTLTGIDGFGQLIELSSRTDENGRVSFEGLIPSVASELTSTTGYTLRETVPDGFVATTPTEFATNLLSGERHDAFASDTDVEVIQNSALRFGNAVLGSIHAFKFEDIDGDGVFDPEFDDPMLGIEFTLSGTNGLGETVQLTSSTDESGRVNFEGLLPSVNDGLGSATGYTLTEVIPEGFVATTGTSFETDLFSREEHVAFAGDANIPVIGDPRMEVDENPALRFGNTVTGSIHAFKFEDVDGDGEFDSTVDRPLPGIEFELSGTTGLGDSVLLTASSDANGRVTFLDLMPSIDSDGVSDATGYTLREIVPDGFIATTSTEFQLDVASREEYVAFTGDAMLSESDPRIEQPEEIGLRFGNLVTGSIHAFKFEDVDADGIFSAVDSPLAGIEFSLSGTNSRGEIVDMTATSDDFGRVTFVGLLPSIDDGIGTGYTLRESVPAGFVSTTETEFYTELRSREEHVAFTGDAMLPPNDPRTELPENIALRFGNTVPGSIHVFKYEDIDGNGEYSSEIDRPMRDVEFTLTGVNGLGESVNLVATTDPSGRAHFEGLIPAIDDGAGYTVTETVPSEFFATTPTEFSTDLRSREEHVPFEGDADLPLDDPRIELPESSALRFGNTVLGAIHAFKFEDRAADGSFTPEVDLPMQDVEFVLTGTNGLGELISESRFTDPDGRVSFEGLIPSISGLGSATGYTLTEVVPDGFVATTETEFTTDVRSGEVFVPFAGDAMIPSGDPRTEFEELSLQFGNTAPGLIEGFKFDDRNGDGLYDSSKDQPIANAEFSLRGTDGLGNMIELTTQTDATGRFSFNDLLPSVSSAGFGTGYTLVYVLPNGHRATTHTPIVNSAGEHVIEVEIDLFSRDGLLAFDSAGQIPDPISVQIEEEHRFGTYFSSETGLIAGFVASSDLDGDGFEDLVVVNDFANPVEFATRLSLLFSNGDTGFSDPINIPMPNRSRPKSAAIGDLEGDGDLDLVVTSMGDPSQRPELPGTNAVLVFRNDGSNDRSTMFSSEPEILMDEACHFPELDSDRDRCDGPVSVVLEHLNSDDVLDIVTADSRSDTVSVLLSPWESQSPMHISVGRNPVKIHAGQINSNDDDHIDLAIVNRGSGDISILLGNGMNGFVVSHSVDGFNEPTDLVLSDLNGDSFMDLAVTDFDPGRVHVLAGDGSGTFQASGIIEVGAGSQSIAAGDLDRDDDGDMDLVVANSDDGSVTLLQNVGGGNFEVASQFEVAPIHFFPDGSVPKVGQSPFEVIVGEFDERDSSLSPNDFAVAHFAYGVSSYFNGFGDPNVDPAPAPLLLAEKPNAKLLKLLDVDGDGEVAPIDALLILNRLNSRTLRSANFSHETVVKYDVSGDGYLTSIDALLVINHLNSVKIRIDTPDLMASELDAAAAAAIQIWRAVEGDGVVDRLSNVDLQIQDLPGLQLGITSRESVTIDVNGAGTGWYTTVDDIWNDERTTNDESMPTAIGTQVDLFTVVLHEFGHVLGYGHSDDPLMRSQLDSGVRILPAGAVDQIFGDSDA